MGAGALFLVGVPVGCPGDSAESWDAALTEQHAELAAADPVGWGAGTDSAHS
jgi:hypothetical protein